MSRPARKLIVRLRMWYADFRGHHGKKWDYEPSENYMKKKNDNVEPEGVEIAVNDVLKNVIEIIIKTKHGRACKG